MEVPVEAACEAIMALASQLPALASLDIDAPSDAHPDSLPVLTSFHDLYSASLRSISMAMVVDEMSGTLALQGLPELEFCQLQWQEPAERLQLDQAAFRCVTGLTSLQLVRVIVSLPDDCFAPLARLADLQLVGCALRHVPLAVGCASVAGSLQDLDLSDNANLQLDGQGYAALLRLRKLRWLSLRKATWQARSWPPHAAT